MASDAVMTGPDNRTPLSDGGSLLQSDGGNSPRSDAGNSPRSDAGDRKRASRFIPEALRRHASETAARRQARKARRIRADGYSLFVGLMKRGLPVIALGLLALILIWPNLEFESSKYRKSVLSQLKLKDVENLTLVKAKYSGTDEKNRPYTVTAEKAIQASTKSDLIRLETPAADLTLHSGKWVAITAVRGEFRQKAKLLQLIGQVSLFHDDGYSLTTGSAKINLDTGSASSTEPVLAKGPMGILKSKGFELRDKGKRILFNGPASLVIYPSEKGGKSPLSLNTKGLTE